MSIFAKAKAKTAISPVSKKKTTRWQLSEAALREAVTALVQSETERKALETRQANLKSQLLRKAEELFASDYVRAEKSPDAPMLLVNPDTGDSVNFVFQDRSGQYGLSEEQEQDLVELLGADKMANLVYEESRFAFNRVIMGIPGVMDCLAKHLDACRSELIASKVLGDDQADELLDVSTKRTLRPGTLDSVTSHVGRDVTRFKQFLQLIGSCAVRYIKV
jgi:hypothetical protein